MTLEIVKGTARKQPVMNVLVFGDPGVGKTEFATSGQGTPGLDDVLFVNIEGGDLTILHKNIDQVTPGRDRNGQPTGDTLRDLEQLALAIANKSPGFEKYRTLVVDSVTELQVRDMDDFAPAADMVKLQDYGRSTKRMQKILRMLRDANINVIFTALAQNVNQKRGSELELVEIGPQMTAKVAASLKGYVDFVWYYTISPSTGERVLVTAPTGPIKAKTRNDAFLKAIGTKITNPNLGKLYTTLCQVLNNEAKAPNPSTMLGTEEKQ